MYMDVEELADLLERGGDPELWMDDGALCRQTDPELWFTPDDSPMTSYDPYARAFCLDCPVLDLCRDYALDLARQEHNPEGMWGGYSKKNRTMLLRGKEPRFGKIPELPPRVDYAPPPMKEEEQEHELLFRVIAEPWTG